MRLQDTDREAFIDVLSEYFEAPTSKLYSCSPMDRLRGGILDAPRGLHALCRYTTEYTLAVSLPISSE